VCVTSMSMSKINLGHAPPHAMDGPARSDVQKLGRESGFGVRSGRVGSGHGARGHGERMNERMKD
jgi:hypothetical protein